MSEKIENLTPEQEAQLPVYRDRWIDIGLSTEPINKDTIEGVVNEVYKSAGLALPKNILFADSPKHAVSIISELCDDGPHKILRDMSYNNHEAGRLGFYAFFREVVGLDGIEKIDPLLELAKRCGWISFYDDVCVVQEKPMTIKMDENNLLHGETGPAIEYRDGFSVYSWHGVRIPAEWIANPESLTPQVALTWENLEQRRCACEILGWVNILKELPNKVLDEDDDPQVGTLVRVTLPDVGDENFLRVMCGTGREFALIVPPEMTTALAANAWTFDIDGDTLRKLEVRT